MNTPIDPNDLIINPNLLGKGLNGIPDLSKMHLFVELTAQRREGSVLVSSGVGTSTNTILNSQNDDIKINMMGFDQDTGQYTTRWSRNYSDTKTNFEGFGITSININVNSSYVPTVEIEFVDIRGSSLFTFGSKSPYSVLFSFPPPIWTLTVKGYYGLALTYTLHFVRQTTKFDAKSGNYYIEASFVGQKYAPLTDVLFKYIDIVPLMNAQPTDDGINLDPGQPPRNTRELIIKAQKLYDDLEKFKTESTLAKEADQARSDFYTAKSLLAAINSANNQMDTEFQNITGLFIKNNDPKSASLFEPTSLDNYDLIIRKASQSSLTTPTEKLIIATQFSNKSNSNVGDVQLSRIVDGLNNVKRILIDEAANINGDIKTSDIKDATPKYNDGSGFISIDITDYYLKAYKDIQTKQHIFETKQDNFKSEINKISVNTLGRVPTIRFIFELLCGDVDKFFSKLKDVGSLAETHHAKYFNKIVDNNQSTKQKISPFPLVIKKGSVVTDKNSSTGSGPLNRDERAYPAEIFIDIETFPEVAFVENFISTYLNIVKSEEILDLKNGLDEQGNNKWMPINPLDSAINGRVAAISPYFSKFNPIPDLISEILNRFYVVSQFSYDQFFYHNDANIITDFFGVDSKQDDLLKFIAFGEAANIVNSITDSNLLNALSVQSNNWKQGIALKNDNFYTTLKSNVAVKAPGGDTVNIYNTFQGSLNKDFIYAPNGTSFLTLNNQIVTKDRKNPNYKGFEMLTNGKPALRTPNDDGSNSGTNANVVDTFLNRYSQSTTRNFLFAGDKPAFDSFTKQNIMFVKDNQAQDDAFDSDFIKENSWFTSPIVESLFSTNANQKDQDVPIIIGKHLSQLENLYLSILSDTDPKVTNNVKAYIFTSLFGRTIPYFDVDSEINQKFAFPAVVEIPRFAHLHMGALSYFYTTGATISGEDEIFYFNNKYKGKFHINTTYNGSNGDATQQIQLISSTDYKELVRYFTGFTNNNGEDGYAVFQNKLIKLINEVQALKLTNLDDKFDAYYRRLAGKDLKSSETDFSKLITGKLTEQLYLLNYTQLTFYPNDSPVDEFTPMANLNNIQSFKDTHDKYFGMFFGEIIRLIDERKKALRKIEDKFQTSIEDNDIKTQCYYSFKNISDRWVLGFGQQGIMGNANVNLIDDFKFIDRAGNDIGEKVVIDFRPIIEMSKDFDVSVFTVMSRILSLNGFEFFPLQNFIDFSNPDGNAKFEDTFKISSSQKVQVKSSPKFVCMYIGGTSSQLDDGAGDFDDDGIQKLESIVDFAKSPTQAFKVSFAKQNQSIFTNIELGTNEHKETNESLAILSEIAQDQSTSSPVPKGQNLFSTYEQRSYTCKVEMLGDIMIQPTQYFVLENVPMFRGAYLILRVMHNISANHMVTSFEGVRIRKIPQPFVRDFATATGVKGGSADAHLTDPNVIGNAFNSNAVNGVNPITNDQTTRLLSPK